MSTVNGVDSSNFSRADVIKTFQVVQYFNTAFSQYPAANISYDIDTDTIFVGGITGQDNGYGNPPYFLIQGAQSYYNGGDVQLAPGVSNFGSYGNVNIFSTSDTLYTDPVFTASGRDSSPRMSFFGKSTVPQQTNAIANSSFQAGTTTGTFHTDDKYGGYTIGQIVTALKAYGLLA
jgi:hypothetical protein